MKPNTVLLPLEISAPSLYFSLENKRYSGDETKKEFLPLVALQLT